MKVLSIDDSKLINDSFKCMLESLTGDQVDVANCGTEGLEYVKHALASGEGYDLILCDYHMPDYKGDEVVKCIRHFESESLILENPSHIVMVTSDDGNSSVLSAMTEGANDYLIKPVRLDDLKKLVEQHQSQPTNQESH